MSYILDNYNNVKNILKTGKIEKLNAKKIYFKKTAAKMSDIEINLKWVILSFVLFF